MADLLATFRQRTEDLISAINDRGGIKATLEGVRRQMAEADRRRSLSKVRAELKRLDNQITEMITAVGVQAVGLHKAQRLSAPELEPLCQHIVDLEDTLAQQIAELRRLEAQTGTRGPQPADCPSCHRGLPDGATFCPHCGASVPTAQHQFCSHCGTELRAGASFCSQCGQEAQ